jgi:predicted phosphodiesterase
MRIFVCGDIHRQYDIAKLHGFQHLMGKDLTKEDYLIICGDVGCIWTGDYHDSNFIEKELETLSPTILFVDGNHENFEALNKFTTEEWKNGKIHQISQNVIHLIRGQVFDFNGIKLFTFGGAKSTDRGYKPTKDGWRKEAGWWQEELPTKEEMEEAWNNLKIHENKVDYIITHDIGTSVLRDLLQITRPSDKTFSDFLEAIEIKVEFKKWFFGHHHRDVSMGKFYGLMDSIMEINTKIK